MSAVPRERVVLDCRWVQVDSGIGQYAYWLARTLPKSAPDLEFEIWLPHTDDPLVRELAMNGDGARRVCIMGNPRHVASTMRASLHLLASGKALYHSPDWIGVPALPGMWRSVVTVHDLIPLVAPEWVPLSMKARHPRVYRAAMKAILRGASAILTDIEPWALEIEKHLGIPRHELQVIPLGVPPARPMTVQQVRTVRLRFNLGEAPYVISVGRPEPYKGLSAVIQAFVRASRSERLVIVGLRDPRYLALREEARLMRGGDRVIFTDTVDPDTLECLYQGASAYFTMSRFEGFGLAPLEAMSRGVPVLAARNSASDHTLGTAACYVDADDETGAAEALGRLLNDSNLRARLAAAGRTQAAQFSWEACARETAAVYRQVLRGSARAPARGERDLARRPTPAELPAEVGWRCTAWA